MPTGPSRSPFLEKVRNAIRVRHSNIRTEEAYLFWVRRFILYHGKRHPTDLGASEVGAFPTHRAVDRKVSPSTQNPALNAVVFLRAGQGGKDRVVTLPDALIAPRQAHLANRKTVFEHDRRAGHGTVYLPSALAHKDPTAPRAWGWQYVFPASTISADPRAELHRRQHVDESAVQKAGRRAVRVAGIHKPARCHTRRHALAPLCSSGARTAAPSKRNWGTPTGAPRRSTRR
jgi:hypothetical protein